MTEHNKSPKSSRNLAECERRTLALEKELADCRAVGEQQRQKIDMYQTLLDHAEGDFSVKDLDGQFVITNRVFEARTRLANETIIGKTSADLFGSAAAERFTKFDREVIATGNAVTNDIPSVFDNGAQIFHNRKFPVANAAGEIVGVGTISKDIAETIAAEREAHETHSQLIDALDSMVDGLVIFDADERLVLCNSQYKELQPSIMDIMVPGTKFEDLLWAAVDKGLHLEAKNRGEEWVAERLRLFRNPGQPFELEFADGSWMRLYERKTSTGGTIGVRLNITELKQRERQLEESEQRLKDAIESIPEGFVLFDADERLVLCNNTYRQMYPKIRDVLVAGSSMETILTAAQDVRRKAGIMDPDGTWLAQQLVEFRGASNSVEIQTTEGKWILVNHRRTADGGIVGIRTDITEQRKINQELVNSEQRLMDAIESISEGFVLFDADEKLVLCNTNYKELSWEIADMLVPGNTLEQILFAAEKVRRSHGLIGADEDWLPRRLEEFRSDAKPVEFEVSPGVWILASHRRTKDGGFVGIRTDITEQRNISQKLADSEQLLADAIESVSEGFVLFDADEKLVFCNTTYREMYWSVKDLLVPGASLDEILTAAAKLRSDAGLIDAGDDWLTNRLFEYRNGTNSVEYQMSAGEWLLASHRRTTVGGIVGIRTDVTEQKKVSQALAESERRLRQVNAELEDRVRLRTEELQESQERLQAIVDQMHDGLAIVEDDHYSLVNPAYGALIGRSSEELLGMPVGSVVAPEYAEMSLDYHRRRVAGEEVPRSYEVEIINAASGDRVPVIISAQQMTLPDGRTVTLTNIQDTSERMRAQRELRDSELRFQHFAESSSDWFWEMDADLRVTYASPSIEKAIGVPPEWYYGKTREEMASENIDNANWRQHLLKLKNREPFRDFLSLRKVEGVPSSYTRTSGVPIFDDEGKFQGYRGTGVNVTDIVNAELALKDAEERLRDFAESSSDWFWEMDADLRFTYVSASVEKVLGVSPEWYVGKTREELRDVDMQDEGWQQHLLQLNKREPFRNFLSLRKAEGVPPSYTRTSGVPIFDGQGVFKGYRGTGVDVTEIVNAELALKNAEERLRDFAESSSDWFWEMDADLRFTFLSASVEKMIGVPREWYYGKSRAEVRSEETQDESWLEHLSQLRDRQPFRDFIVRLDLDDLPTAYAKTSGVPVFDDNNVFQGYRGIGVDVTDTIATERALRQAEAKFRGIFEQAALGIALSTTCGEILSVNNQLCKILQTEAESLLGTRGHEFLNQAVFEKAKEQLNQLLSYETPVGDVEIHYQLSGGEERWLNVAVSLLKDEESDHVDVLWIVQDISERKIAENSLRESETRFQHFAESSSDWFWEMDADLRFTFLSASVEKMIGVPRQWYYGKTRAEVRSEETQDESWLQHLSLLRDRQPFRDFIVRLDLDSLPTAFTKTSGVPIFDDNNVFQGYRGIGVDVTDTFATERALRQAEAKFRGIFEQAALGIALSTPSGEILSVNNQLCNILQIEAENLLDARGQELLNQVVFEKAKEQLNRLLSFEASDGEMEIHYQPSDGEERWFDVTVSLLRDEESDHVDVLWIVQDISKRRQAEIGLKDAQGELLRKQRLSTLGQLTATVSHELRNPLGTMQTSTHILRKEIQDAQPRVERALGRLERGIDRCDNIIEDLLDFTRGTDAKLSPVELDTWLAELLDEQTTSPGIVIERQFGLHDYEVVIDRERLRRAIVNAYENGLQAMLGDRENNTTHANNRLIVATRIIDDRVEITLEDNGPGIPADMMEKIFEPLFSTKNFGVGLGLTVIKQIMEQHEGGVEIHPNEDRGTRFTLWLPVSTTKK